jgi:hypothetical protein
MIWFMLMSVELDIWEMFLSRLSILFSGFIIVRLIDCFVCGRLFILLFMSLLVLTLLVSPPSHLPHPSTSIAYPPVISTLSFGHR